MGRNSVHKIKRPPRYSQPASVVRLEDEYDLYELIKQTSNPLILVLEGVQDPHNLGACLRTASGAGVTAVIAPVKGSCS
ncbi:MAG: TrmH family RNA methyltransferase, partial [Verrucomicrobiota bacterium]|nr:TrmH family RNA methyltransferase [Verrucomicrobiota bacterium]